MQKIIVSFVLLLAIANPLKAQELNCQVQLNHQQIQGTNTQVFQTLQAAIYEFMNNRTWTDHAYNNDERIECSIMINLTEQIGSNRFVGTISVQSRRPVYNTAYNTVLLNYQEKKGDFRFEYIENEPLEFNENTHTSNLTSVLAFYAYIILGLDYDTFSEEGGTSYFQKAQKIVTNAQSTSEPGWKPYESLKNRYWLAEDLLNDVYNPIRRCLYRYHRLGLDRMSDKLEAGRAEIAESLRLLQRVHRAKPSSFLMNLFFTAKSDEIVNIFSGSNSPMEKTKVANALKEIDVANSNKYDKITQSNN